MKKTKHNPPEKKSPKPNFIKLSKLQANYLYEVRNRQRKEFSEALQVIYEELGIYEKVLKAPPGTYNLRPDFSGLDIIPVDSQNKEKTDPEKPADPKKETE